MEITQLTIKIIVLLLPGIFGTFILEKLYFKEKIENRTFAVSVILIGFVSYFLLSVIQNIIEILKNGFNNYEPIIISFFKALINQEEQILLREVLFSTILGIIIGIFSAYIINNGTFYKIFREIIHITNSTGQDVWGELFDNNTKGIGNFVYVIDDEANRVYGGWVTNYSKHSQEPELLLKNVKVFNNEGREELYEVDKMYIKYNKEKMIIELTNTNKEVEKWKIIKNPEEKNNI